MPTRKPATFSPAGNAVARKIELRRRRQKNLPSPGAFGIWSEDDGESFWLPEPCGGHMTLKMSPDTFPSKKYMAAVQIIAPGGTLPDHGHGAQDEFLFVYDGRGRVFVDGVSHPLRPGSLVYVGKHRKHGFINDGNKPLKIFFLCVPSAGVEHMMRAVGKRRRRGSRPPIDFDHPDEKRFMPILERYTYSRPDQMVAGGTGKKYPGR
ncbi:MAG: cupin domain-containing protein [Alphaproteobacteria bacterium]|nr:cupin domain-containing protein [Alphaproteobacteria bacterium]